MVRIASGNRHLAIHRRLSFGKDREVGFEGNEGGCQVGGLTTIDVRESIGLHTVATVGVDAFQIRCWRYGVVFSFWEGPVAPLLSISKFGSDPEQRVEDMLTCSPLVRLERSI